MKLLTRLRRLLGPRGGVCAMRTGSDASDWRALRADILDAFAEARHRHPTGRDWRIDILVGATLPPPVNPADARASTELGAWLQCSGFNFGLHRAVGDGPSATAHRLIIRCRL